MSRRPRISAESVEHPPLPGRSRSFRYPPLARRAWRAIPGPPRLESHRAETRHQQDEGRQPPLVEGGNRHSIGRVTRTARIDDAAIHLQAAITVPAIGQSNRERVAVDRRGQRVPMRWLAWAITVSFLTSLASSSA